MVTNVPKSDDGRVPACPDCDRSGQVHKRSGRPNAYVGDADDPYVCYHCKASFEAPAWREPKENPIRNENGGRPASVDSDLLDRVRAATDPPEAL